MSPGGWGGAQGGTAGCTGAAPGPVGWGRQAGGGGARSCSHFCSRLMRASTSAKLSSTTARFSFIVFWTCGGGGGVSGAGRERGGRTGSPPKPPAGPHLCQQRAVVLQSGSHLLLRGVQVHQDLHEPRGWGETLGVRDRSSDPQSPPCTPRLPRAPRPLTLLMQVPQGQQALHHVRQTAGHGVPALHHLIDLVDLGDDRRCGGGSALLRRGCSPPPPHYRGLSPHPVLTLLCVSASCTTALCLAISFTFPRTLCEGVADGTPNHAVSPPPPHCWRRPRAPPPTSPSSPHLQPGLHLVQRSRIQHVHLGLQDLHGLLQMESLGEGGQELPAALG